MYRLPTNTINQAKDSEGLGLTFFRWAFRTIRYFIELGAM
jgi:hypothetical protein